MRNPTPAEVKNIFKYTYLLFDKYKDAKTEQDFEMLVEEARKIQAQYPFQICEKIIVEVLSVIETYWREQ